MAGCELYAFEFHVQQLKTSEELQDVLLEVKLFQGAPAILKSGRPYCQAEPPTVRKIACSGDSVGDDQENEENFGPFTLDMESVATDLKEKENSEDSSEQTEQNEVISKPPVKNPRGEETESEDTAKGLDASDSAHAISRGGSDARLAADGGKSRSSEKQGSEKFKQSLRMFPEDPTGQPYHKVKKGELVQEDVYSDSSKRTTACQEDEQVDTAGSVTPTRAEEPTVREEQDVHETKEEDSTIVHEFEKLETDIAKDLPAEKQSTGAIKNTFEAGLTMVLGMPPFGMLHNLQRHPLQVKVCSASCELTATGRLDLSPLCEAVLRAERGPPTPVISSTEVLLSAYGDFKADLCCSIKLFAFGSKVVNQIVLPGSPNEMMNCKRAEEVPQFKTYNMDAQDLPPVISCPEQISLRHTKFPHDKETVEEYPKAKGNERFFVEEDLVFCPNNRIIAPRPSDNYETMKWKIDRLLGLATVKEEEHDQAEEQLQKKINAEMEERAQKLNEWYKQKQIQLEAQKSEMDKKKRETRAILKKILRGMNEPDPIGSGGGAKLAEEEDFEMEGVVEDAEVVRDPKRLYEEIRRRQTEEKMIKYYKRLFRKMLRALELERKHGTGLLRRKEKRGTMKDLLGELETYAADDVERAYTQVMKFRKEGEAKAWDLDLWPDIPEENEAEELEGGEEDGLQISLESN